MAGNGIAEDKCICTAYHKPEEKDPAPAGPFKVEQTAYLISRSCARRFNALPASVLFGTTGLDSPYPLAFS